jgi:shikimate dehydrogenase
VARAAAVLGRPVGHSLSPALHRAAYAALGLDWTYEAIDCGVDDLRAVLASRTDWAGLSCTMPLKRAALEIADEVDDAAAVVGAANTLIPAGGAWRAANTDVSGIVEAMGEGGASSPGDVTLLGAGGTAQAAVVACAKLGVRSVEVLVRDPARTGELRATAGRAGVDVVVGALDARADGLAADVVVSTLPPRAADALANRSWHPGQLIVDVVYDPWPTALAAAASAAGARVIGGDVVLLHQAAAQVELMTGQAAPLAAMRAAIDDVRRGAGGG